MRRFRMPGCLLAAALLCLWLASASASDAENLALTGGDVQSLEELSAYPSLQSLTLVDCPAFDLTPLAGCPQLTSLTIRWSEAYAGGGTYDLSPLKNCARLNTLTLAGSGIADLSALPGLARLRTLSVEDTAVTDYSPIESLNLKHLRLYGADAASVARIFTAAGRALESADIGGCELTPEACDEILSCTKLISLRFTDAEGIDGESARWAKLKNLTTLTVTGGSATSLKFCDSYVSTVGVKLLGVSVGGAACSVDFDKYFLKTADVPEAELEKLLRGDGRRWQYAVIHNGGEPYSQHIVAAFSDIISLLSLDIQALATDAFDPAAWAGFPKLSQLKFSDCPVVSLEMLGTLPGLLRLSVRDAAVGGAAKIASLKKLEQLTLVNCTADDWAFTDTLLSIALYQLDLSGCNGPDSLAFLKSLEKLKALVLEYAPVTDLAPLAGMKLETLSLFGCTIADYTPLKTLTSLKRLYCGEGAALPTLPCRVIYQPVTPAE